MLDKAFRLAYANHRVDNLPELVGIQIAPTNKGQEEYWNGGGGILGTAHPIFRQFTGYHLCVFPKEEPRGSGVGV